MPTTVPTKAQFQQTTDLTVVTSAKRNADLILLRIDELLDMYHGTDVEKMQMMLLGRIYFAADGWLRLCDRGDASVNSRRRPGVFAFYTAVVDRLCEFTGIDEKRNLLPSWLTETFGKNMAAHGAKLDITEDSAEYLTPAAAAQYKLKFTGGLAYQQQWWLKKSSWVLANTIGVDDRTQGGAASRPIPTDSGGYVMTLSGEFFHGPHFSGKNYNQNGRYHSSYTAGEAIRCAGVFKINNGRVVHIDTDSGHYQPGESNLVMAVETLLMYGVDIRALRVTPHQKSETDGRSFLDAANNQAVFTDARHRIEPVRTALEMASVKKTVSAHEKMIERKTAFELFKAHWKPKSSGPPAHGPVGKKDCRECQAQKHLFADFEEAVARAGGMDKVSTARAAAQLVAPPDPPGAPARPAPPAILGGYVAPVPPPASAVRAPIVGAPLAPTPGVPTPPGHVVRVHQRPRR